MKKLLFVLFSLVAFFATGNLLSQDIIIKNDKTEIKAKVIEIQEEFIKYTLFESPNGPLRNIRISEVFMVIYQDGTRETFNSQEDVMINKEKVREIVKETENLNSNPIEKDQVCVKIRDVRADPLKIGYRYNSALFYIPKVKKDKKNTFYPDIQNLFNKEFREKGFCLASNVSKSNYLLEVNVTQIEFNDYDAFTHINLVYICSVDVSLKDQSTNKVIYNEDLTYSHKCKKSRCDKSGFGVEVDNIVQQLLNDPEFSQIISY